MRYLFTFFLFYSISAGTITAQESSRHKSNDTRFPQVELPAKYVLIHPKPVLTGIPELLSAPKNAYKKTTNLAMIPEMEMDKEDVSGYANLAEFMQSRLAGVSITKNPASPYGYDILIRGKKSLIASNAPLLVLNGMAVPALNLNSIDPNHVKSIDVLKGSDATIWGSRGANGVIVIMTK